MAKRIFNADRRGTTVCNDTALLTIALTCGTSNEVDLFLGTPPLVLSGPGANPDLGAWAIFRSCPAEG